MDFLTIRSEGDYIATKRIAYRYHPYPVEACVAIEINGKKYKVVEDLGFSNAREQYAKVVLTEQGERTAVRGAYRGAKWRFTHPLVLDSLGGPATGQGKPG